MMTRAIKAEFRKLFTTRLWWGMAIGIFLAGAAMAALFAFMVTASTPGAEGTPQGTKSQMASLVYTGGLSMAYVLTMTIGVLSIGQEYRHQTITSTLLAVPRRATAMIAKVISLLGIGAFYGIISLIGSVAVGASILASKGFSPFPGSDVFRTLALSLLVLGLWALIGLGAGILMKNQVTALLVMIGAAWIVEPLASLGLSFVSWGSKVVPYLPSAATSAIVNQPSQSPTVHQLSWWAGALVLIGYAAVLTILGMIRVQRSDVS